MRAAVNVPCLGHGLGLNPWVRFGFDLGGW